MNKWTKKEVLSLKKLASNPRLSVMQIAGKLSRSYHSINSKLYELKGEEYFLNGTPWDRKDIKKLAKMIDISNDKVCKKLMRGPKEINRMRFAIRRGKVQF